MNVEEIPAMLSSEITARKLSDSLYNCSLILFLHLKTIYNDKSAVNGVSVESKVRKTVKKFTIFISSSNLSLCISSVV